MAADPNWSRAFFANGACSHYTAEAVFTVDGQHVGYLCPECDRALPANWSSIPPTPESRAAALLIAAGYDPLDAVEVTGVSHVAAECPQQVEITALADPEARYVHGNCQDA